MAPPPFSPGFLARFELLRPLGEGGVASVWQARQRDLDRLCALKAFRPTYFDSEEAKARFLDEGRLLARIAHPNVVQVYDSGDDGEVLFLVLEYIQGRDLRDEIARAATPGTPGALRPGRALEVAAAIAEGLAVAHEDGIVHRDLKPENVLIGADLVPKVADFGFAKVSPEAFQRSYSTREGIILGTPHYVAPEVVRRQETSPKADLYALGIILWEMLLGRPPFAADNDTATLLMHVSEPVPRAARDLPGLPPEIDDLIQWCCQKDPEKRPSSAASLAKVLREATEKVPTWTRDSERRAMISRAGTVQVPRIPTDIARPRAHVSPWPRRLALLAGVTGVLAALTRLLPDSQASVPRDLEVAACMNGFLVTWRTPGEALGRLAYRRSPDGTWQELRETTPTREHRLVVGDLEPAEHELRVLHEGGEVPLPPIRVHRLKRDQLRLVPEATGESLRLELRTSLPVQVALTAGAPPPADAWSPLAEEHSLTVAIGEDEDWVAPRLFLRDPAGNLQDELLGHPVRGWKRLGLEVAGELERLDLDLGARAQDLEQRAQALTRSAEAEIRRLEAEIEERATERNPNLHHYEAVRQALSKLGEPFEAALEGSPVLQAVARSGPRLERFLTSPEVPGPARQRLHAQLQKILPLDATAEAFGAPGPLGSSVLLHSLVPVIRTPPAGVAGRMTALRGHVSAGRGLHLLRNSTIQTQILKLENLATVDYGLGGMLARKASEDYYKVDLDRAPVEVEASLSLPEPSRDRPKEVHLHAYNMTPWLLVTLSLDPEGPDPPVPTVVRNSAATFPGLVGNASIQIHHDQIFTARFPAWMLPPGRYTLRVRGDHVPGLNRTLTWGLQDLFVTW